MKRYLNSDWKLDFREHKGLEVQIPSSVYSVLLENKLMKDPFYRDNEYEVRDLCYEDCEFCTEVNITKEELERDKIILRFNGVDTIAYLYINDIFVGFMNNMHRSFEFNIKEVIKLGSNSIKLIIKSPIKYIQEANQRYELWGVDTTMEGYPHIRKAHCMFGWDWGPQLPDMGIWRDVELFMYDTARIEDVYIRQSHNIEPGIGTEINADSVGEGLLGHERAYLAWLDSIFEKYPDLIIENCSSGGLRIDYAMLSRHSIQSTSDQDDYRRYAAIAANSPSGLTPEQSAVWSYPLTEGDKEEVIFNMVNAMLLRIHQSGHLVYLNDERKKLVKEGLDYYKTIREDIKNALPFWPLGLSKFSDTWVSLGLKVDNKIYVAVWRRNSEDNTCLIPIQGIKGKKVSVKCAYPKEENCEYNWNQYAGTLSVKFSKQFSARIFEIKVN